MENVQLNRLGRGRGLVLAALVLAAGAATAIEAGAIGALALRSDGAWQIVHGVRSLALLSVGIVFGFAALWVPRIWRDSMVHLASAARAR